MSVSGKWLAVAIATSVCATGSQAAVLYSQTTANTGIAGLGAPVAVTDPSISGLDNCLATEGCMGFGSAVPMQPFALSFTVTPADLASIMGSTGSGMLTVTAARDIGVTAGGTPPATEFLVVSAEGGVSLGNLYQNLVSTVSSSIPGRCTNGPGAANEGPPVALDCGPNFDNDTTATESLPISQADFETFAADGTVTIVIDPTASVGRLKLFPRPWSSTAPRRPCRSRVRSPLSVLASLVWPRREGSAGSEAVCNNRTAERGVDGQGGSRKGASDVLAVT
jgi:hypothetical protein